MEDVECTAHSKNIAEMGEWLDLHMPNPPLPEPQRWSIGVDITNSRFGVRFADDNDAFMFKLVWG